MVKGYLDYIDKQDCERRGLVRDEADGKVIYRKLSALERYAREGWLDKGGNADDRLSAGLILAADFYKARINGSANRNMSMVRVDGSGSGELTNAEIWARRRLADAMRAVPAEFWPVVNMVCCFDEDIIGEGNNKGQRLDDKKQQMQLLRLGLDRLVKHYGKKINRDCKIVLDTVRRS